MVGQGVEVTWSPASGTPVTTYQLRVTNTGQDPDTFDLATAGPAGLVASLASTAVTLAPGGSQAVNVTLGALDFAFPGSLDLIGTATSRANAAVKDSATAEVNLPATQGMSADCDPASKELPAPGAASFLLLVRNTGNTEDAYQADIVGSSGPVTASLNGLDGQPAQSVPTFRLPGLSTAAIVFNAILTAPGQGEVSVRVGSLSDAAIADTALATIHTPLPEPTLDHFLGYKTKPPQGSKCGQDAPKRKGQACQAEEECGGHEEDADGNLETAFCVPKGFPRGRQVILADRFETKRFDIRKPLSLYNPVDKNSEGVHDPETHLRSYAIKQSHAQPPQPRHVKHRLRVENQFGELFVTTIEPRRLLVPTAKSLTGPVDPPDPEAHDLDHFKCYKVSTTKGAPKFPKGVQAVAVDQFNQPKRYDIQKPKRLCVAADKNGEGLKNPDASLMCYRIKPAQHEPKHVKLRGIHINNQLGPERFDTVKDNELCVPSEISDLGIVR